MALNGRGTGSFIQNIGRTFGTQEVIVIHAHGTAEEQRTELESQVQGSKAYFDVDAPVYEGDAMELADPRGGRRTVHIFKVKINEAPGSFGGGMSHIVASYSDTPARARGQQASQIIHGNAVIVSGSHVNVALDNGSITQHFAVTAGFEVLARSVEDALSLMEQRQDLDPDERSAAQEAGTAVLTAIVEPNPDLSLIKKALATMRGVLHSAVTAGAGAAASALITQLVL
ncbi:hypothetical protein [Cryobacterium sp. PH29-G1]|uniref:hypothetical protein n=1 Tax=Cryobacterium sp. PH29-G1 TaxID=3046211 RepID=UPI0024B943F9|nr:hypothetical protein [Cryobacterium sp. PH29-G1]MDJ0350870.1 hypothetical protein [Cryobacterium sp. PH29-G1]